MIQTIGHNGIPHLTDMLVKVPDGQGILGF